MLDLSRSSSSPGHWLLTLAMAFVAQAALAAVVTVPSPPPGRQAKAKAAITINPSSGSFREITRQAELTDLGAGYLSNNPPARVVSAVGSGAVVSVNLSPFLRSVSVTSGGSSYSDDATIVIMPPRTNDLQAALNDFSIDTIQLEDGLYFQNATINRPLTIQGRGKGRTVISGGLLDSVFRVLPGVTLTLRDLTLIDGLAPNGGGIDNDAGVVTLERCEIRNCRAYGLLGQGGGILNHGAARLSLIDCDLRDNTARRSGGAVCNSGLHTALLLTVHGLTGTKVLDSVNSSFVGFTPPSDASESSFDTTITAQDSMLEGMLDVIGDLPTLFGPVGTNNFDPSSGWSTFGMPTLSLQNCTLDRNRTGKGAAQAQTTLFVTVPVGIKDVHCDLSGCITNFYYQTIETHPADPSLLSFGAGIQNELGLLILQNSTLTRNENSSDLVAYGGAISSTMGVVRVSDSRLADNDVKSTTVLCAGGALYSFASITKATDSQFNGNDVTAGIFLSSGGAVKNTALSFMDIERCQLNSNTSGGGGGLANDYLAFTMLKDSMAISNAISGIVGAAGGGVRNEKGGNVVLEGCTLSGNLATGLAKGGGLYNHVQSSTNLSNPIRVATATLQNCTISGNRVDGTGTLGIPLEALGAGLYNGSSELGAANLFVSACTIVDNTASGGLVHLGGGVYNTALANIKLKVWNSRLGISTAQLANNIIAHNSPDDCRNMPGALTVSLGYNLDSDGSGTASAPLSDPFLGNASFLTVTDAGLSPLQNNGGPTPTHALRVGSPAINRGSTDGAAEGASLATDQRGVSRSVGGRRDIGAYESVAPVINPETYATFEDLALAVATPGVLRNDFGDLQQSVLVSTVAHGSLTLSSDGKFTYLPAANFVGTDSFLYQVVDSGGRASAPATVTITVAPRLDFLGMTPTPGSVAERNTAITLTFDEPVNGVDLLQKVVVRGSVSGYATVSPYLPPSSTTFTLVTLPFVRGEEVTVTIADTLTSTGGSLLFPKVPSMTFSIFTNRPPVVVNDSRTTLEDTPLNVGLSQRITANDIDAEGDPLTVAYLVHRGTLGGLWTRFGQGIQTTYEGGEWPDGYYVYRQPTPVTDAATGHGRIDLRADGTFTYRPAPDFVGTDSFDYEVTDGLLRSRYGTVTIAVTPVNDAPTARPDRYLSYSAAADRGVLVNDSDPEGDSLTATLVTPPARGSIVFNSDGSFVYTPGSGFSGVDYFTYQASDGQLASLPAQVKIGNTAPVALPDAYPSNAGLPLTVNATQGVLVNDQDPDGDTVLTAWLSTAPAHGTLVLAQDGSFTYTPTNGYTGSDVFFYAAYDQQRKASSPARVKIGNTAPLANDDGGYVTFDGGTLSVPGAQGVLANDTDPDNDPTLTARLISGPAHGTLTLNADGSFVYTPASSYLGSDSFTYVVRDGSLDSAVATVSLQSLGKLRVTAISPARHSSSAPTNSTLQVSFNLNLNPSSLAGRLVIEGSLTGRRTFTSSVSGAMVTLDPTSDFLPGEIVTVSIKAGIRSQGFEALDTPINWRFRIASPRGGRTGFVRTEPGTTPHTGQSVALGDLNGDGYPDAFVTSFNELPTLLMNNGNRTFTERQESLGFGSAASSPAASILADFNGDGRLDVFARGSGPSGFGFDIPLLRIGINSGAGLFPTTLSVPTGYDSGVYLPSHVEAGDFDGDGDVDLFGADFNRVWIWRNDGAGHFTVDPNSVVTHPGSHNAGAIGDVDNDGDLDVYLVGFRGDELFLNHGDGTFTLVTAGLSTRTAQSVALWDINGDGSLDVVRTAAYLGGDVAVWYNDGTGSFGPGSQTLVAPGTVTVQGLALGDLDGDGSLDLWQAIPRNGGGTGGGDALWFGNGTGGFDWPGPLLGTSDSRGVALADLDRDGDLDAFVANMDVGVSTPTPARAEVWYNQAPPKAVNDFYAANGSSPVIVAASGVLVNDSVGDGGSIQAVLVSPPSQGTVTLDANGSFTYTPGGSFPGTDVFTYRAVDSQGQSGIARVKIGNTPPIAVNDPGLILIADTFNRVSAPGVLSNDSDAQNDPLTAVLLTGPAHGTVQLSPDGSFSYQPSAGYSGPDSFQYRASDGVAFSSAATVTLDVRAALIIVESTPPPNEVSISGSTTFSVRFNHPIQSSTVAANVTLSSEETGERTFTFSLIGTTLLVHPTRSLIAGEHLTLVLASGLEAVNGARLLQPVARQFIVAAPTGQGNFTDSGQRLGATDRANFQTKMGDLDGDGDLDAVVVKGGSNLGPEQGPGFAEIWRNDGAGTFTVGGQKLGVNPFRSELGDVNGDGDLDLLLGDNTLWLNNGAGVFSASLQTFNVGNSTDPVFKFADVDDDGDLDILRLFRLPDLTYKMAVFLNDGAGNFTENPASVSAITFGGLRIASTIKASVAVGDVNGDGAVDVLVRQLFSGSTLVWLNDGTGKFRDSTLAFGSGSGDFISLADLDGDGDLDALMPPPGFSSGGSYIWLNDGAGRFTSSGAIYPPDAFIRDIRLGDVDGDGDLDAVVWQDLPSSGYVVTQYRNDGRGNFAAGGTSFTLTRSGTVIASSFELGDVNGDGALDLFLGGFFDSIQVWLNGSVLAPLEGFASTTINDDSTVSPFSGVTIAAPAGSTVTAAVTLDNAAKGGFTAASLAASGFTGPVGATYSLSGRTSAAAQAALRQLVFAPVANRLPPGNLDAVILTVVASDGAISRTNQTTTITVVSLNDAPTAVADFGTGFNTTDGASVTTASVLANDFDPDAGDTLAITGIDTSATLGVVTPQGNGTFLYQPLDRFLSLATGATATDTFAYSIRDAAGAVSSTTVEITINGSNQAPNANNDSLAVNEGSGPTAITPLVLLNDTDPDTGDKAGFIITSVETTGTLGLVQLVNGDLRYNPAGVPNLTPGAIGTDSFRYTVSDGHGGTASATVNITVTGVNDAPALGADLLSLMSDAAITNLTERIRSNDSDPDPGETAGLTIVGLDPTGTRGFVALTTDALVLYQPTNFAHLASGESGTDRFGYLVSDVHGATSTGQVTITIIGTNDAPTAVADYVIFENRARSREITAELKANDTDVDGPASALVITGVNPGTDPKGTVTFSNGIVSYEPSPSLSLTNLEVATDTFTYTLADAESATSSAVVTVYIVGRNTAPVADDATLTANEDQPLNGSVTASDADGNPLTFAVVTPPANGTLTLHADGQFSYTPSLNFNGGDSFTFLANDGTEDSAPATVTVSVAPVNDAPSFVSGADPTVDEDAGPQSVPNWATLISAGPIDESGQTVGFALTQNNPGLFSAPPSVSPDGTLTYTPAANANGSATVTVTLQDNGGTANGGADISAPQSFTITVRPVNDVPSFVAGADRTVGEDAGPQAVSSWATAISAGAANETGQTLAFELANDNPGLFSTPPAIAPDGTLTFAPSPQANGQALVTVILKDDGGVDRNGVDTSAPQSFTITVRPVNDAPSFVSGADPTVDEDAGPQVVPNWAIGIRAGPADESGQVVSFVVIQDNPSLFSTPPAIRPDGTLTYTPAADANGVATVTVTLRDDGGTAEGGVDMSPPVSFTLTVRPVNDLPVITGLEFVSFNEGDLAVNGGTWFDVDGDPVTLRASLGDIRQSGGDWNWSFQTTDGPAESQDVAITADDGQGGVVRVRFSLEVLNVAPVVTLVAPEAGFLASVGTAIRFEASFTDPGVGEGDTHQAVWTFRNLDAPEATVAGTVTGRVVADELEFLTPGIYSVSLTVTDKDGAPGVADTVLWNKEPLPAFVVIYDPAGKFVTGGGWIWSLPGSMVWAPEVEGKATFGFNSKYTKGATVPSGQTQFQFKAGELRFDSTSYQWLVVAGSRAKFKGEGTIDGVPDVYGFMVEAIDGGLERKGDPDRFRIKIWHKTTGTVVYDNQMGTDENAALDDATILGGGGVVIH